MVVFTGALIRELRKAAGISQESLSRASGMSQAKLSLVERDCVPLRPAEAARVKSALDIEVHRRFELFKSYFRQGSRVETDDGIKLSRPWDGESKEVPRAGGPRLTLGQDRNVIRSSDEEEKPNKPLHHRSGH